MRTLIANKSIGPDEFTKGLYQTSKGELTSILLTLFPKLQRMEHPDLILCDYHYLDTKTRQRYWKKKRRKLHAGISECIEEKILTKYLSNQTQQYIKRIIYCDQVGFIPGMRGWFSICKSINVIHHITKLKD